jgi:GGDEF domain-containing protein
LSILDNRETGADAAEAVTDRLATAVDEDAGCENVGASWRLATYDPADEPRIVLAHADAALYDAKRKLYSDGIPVGALADVAVC